MIRPAVAGLWLRRAEERAGDAAINLSRDAMDVDAEAKRLDLLLLGLQLAKFRGEAEPQRMLVDSGTTISKYTARDGMDQPLVHWTPSISPPGLIIHSADRLPAWRPTCFSAH